MIVLALVFGCGRWASEIARRKNRNPNVFFAVGALLPVVGVVIAAAMPAGPPAPAPVLVTVVCPRCDSRQEADQREPTFRCWHCRTFSPVGPFTVIGGFPADGD